MKQFTRIVAAVVDTKKATLYKQDGTTEDILQGDTRLRPILEKITPLLAVQGYADIDLSTENSWKEFEEQSNGTVKFFKIAKSKLASWFGSKDEEVKPEPVAALPSGIFGSPPQVTKAQKVIAEIMKHAVPVNAQNFSEENIATQRPTAESGGNTPNDQIYDGKDSHFDKHTETIVAVTDKGKVIPGVERIKSQFTGASKTGNTKGMEVFLHRIAKVMEKRKHTVEDLLRFMERGDLPVADDGTIVIYKKLIRREGHYVDGHSKNVKQKVGSLVHMDESLVDPNRRNECSNGLHVARRGYISGFSGDVIVIAKVAPEDVIAVPDYDANKMRVCAYHIVAELTQAQYQAINGNRPMSGAEGGTELLNKIISGDHVGILEKVKIGGGMGSNLSITPINTEAPKAVRKAQKKKAKKALKAKKKTKKPVKQAKTLEAEVHNTDTPVDVKKLAKKTKDQTVSIAEETETKVLTQVDVVKAMYNAAIAGSKTKAQELLDYKKKAKKGWKVWGLDESTGDTLRGMLE